jgi:pyrroloquinoline quinone biosynthesis protein D
VARPEPAVDDSPETWAPRLRRGGRLHRDDARGVDLLLVPERVIRLSDTASAVLRLCDGARTVADIVLELQARYEGTQLRSEVVAFLGQARDERWLA